MKMPILRNKTMVVNMKETGSRFEQKIFNFFFSFYKIIVKIFPMFNQNLIVNRRAKIKIQSAQFSVMESFINILIAKEKIPGFFFNN